MELRLHAILQCTLQTVSTVVCYIIVNIIAAVLFIA